MLAMQSLDNSRSSSEYLLLSLLGASMCLLKNMHLTRALRAHTPHTPCIYLQHHADDLYLHINAQLCTRAEGCCILIVGTVEGCGYDDQQKYTDACRQCYSIRSTVRPVFHQIWQICYYKSLRCLDVKNC